MGPPWLIIHAHRKHLSRGVHAGLMPRWLQTCTLTGSLSRR